MRLVNGLYFIGGLVATYTLTILATSPEVYPQLGINPDPWFQMAIAAAAAGALIQTGIAGVRCMES